MHPHKCALLQQATAHNVRIYGILKLDISSKKKKKKLRSERYAL